MINLKDFCVIAFRLTVDNFRKAFIPFGSDDAQEEKSHTSSWPEADPADPQLEALIADPPEDAGTLELEVCIQC